VSGVNVVSFQGSEECKSDGIIKVFEKAEQYLAQGDTSAEVIPVVLLDEVGLAEISRHNPLKVLHSLLEPAFGAKPKVAVVGISNWALDAAKMNRAIHLSRPDPSERDLIMTANKILESFDQDEHIQKRLADKTRQIAGDYHQYYRNQVVKNFHGLRDYCKYSLCWSLYCTMTIVCGSHGLLLRCFD
jgi:hypothetical protein